jgi:hypothetical protein
MHSQPNQTQPTVPANAPIAHAPVQDLPQHPKVSYGSPNHAPANEAEKDKELQAAAQEVDKKLGGNHHHHDTKHDSHKHPAEAVKSAESPTHHSGEIPLGKSSAKPHEDENGTHDTIFIDQEGNLHAR